MNNKLILESLSMDLRRVAIGMHRGSTKMAHRFIEEALKRKSEVNYSTIQPYVRALLDGLPNKLTQSDTSHIAEDSLMLSTLFQNYTQTHLK